jgi:hypothetical protein
MVTRISVLGGIVNRPANVTYRPSFGFDVLWPVFLFPAMKGRTARIWLGYVTRGPPAQQPTIRLPHRTAVLPSARN